MLNGNSRWEGRPALIISTRELVCGEPPKTARVLKILTRRRRKRPQIVVDEAALEPKAKVKFEPEQPEVKAKPEGPEVNAPEAPEDNDVKDLETHDKNDNKTIATIANDVTEVKDSITDKPKSTVVTIEFVAKC